MNKKPIKSSTTTKPKATSNATKGPKTTEETTIVSKFQSSCETQNFGLFWLDENFDQKNVHCQSLIKGLQAIVKKMDVFDEATNCFKEMNNSREQNIYFIISNPTEANLEQADRLAKVTKIFIFSDRNTSKADWLKKWKKIQNVYTNTDDLCKSLKKEQIKSEKEGDDLCFIALNDIKQRNLGELDQSFMYTQLIKEILLQMPYDTKSVRDLVNYCTMNQSKIGVTLNGLAEFQTDYHKEQTPIWWYTKDIFTYQLVNWALREQEFDVIVQLGFFINDLHQQLLQMGQKQAKTRPKLLKLYRGQAMDPDRFKDLRASQGGLLAFNGFLSTSKEQSVAEGFIERAFQEGASLAILFTITVASSMASAVYADIEEVSFYQKVEREVLFSLGTVFHIGAIERIPDSRAVWSVSLELTDNTDEKLNALMDRIRIEIDGSTPLYRLGALMIKVGEYFRAEAIYNKMLSDTTDEKEKGSIYYQLGFIKYKQKEARTALNLYQNALRINRKYLGDDHINVASVYNNIGLAFDSLNDSKQALENYQKALSVYRKTLSDDPAIAACYNNIASVYDHQGDHKKALEFYEKAKQIYKNKLGDNHPSLATAENNIGLVHLKLNHYQQALACFETALTIGTKALPPEHPDLVAFENHLRTTHQKLNKHK